MVITIHMPTARVCLDKCLTANLKQIEMLLGIFKIRLLTFLQRRKVFYFTLMNSLKVYYPINLSSRQNRHA